MKCSVCGQETYNCSWEGDKCFSCREKERLAKLAEYLQNDEETETSCESDIICPYCGYRYEADFESDYCYNEGDYEEQCPECEKTFTISTSVSITYNTTRKEQK